MRYNFYSTTQALREVLSPFSKDLNNKVLISLTKELAKHLSYDEVLKDIAPSRRLALSGKFSKRNCFR